MKALTLSMIMTGLVSTSLFVGCGDKEDDSGDGGADGGGSDGGGDGGGDGGADGGGSDGGGSSDDYLEITGMHLDWSDAIIESAHGTITYADSPVPSAFQITLSTDDWDYSSEDEDNYCAMVWVTDAAPVSTGCSGCWPGMAWEVDTNAAPTLYGSCDELDPDEWGKNVADGFAGMDVIYGYGDDTDGIAQNVVDKYGDKYGWTEPNTWGSWIVSTALNLGEMQWGWSYALNVEGTVLIGDTPVDQTGAFAPDGYYQGIGSYYFPIE